MWRITITFVIVLAASTTLAVPTGSTSSGRFSDRSLRIGGSTSVTTASDNTPSNGFSLSFVPLFSLLANFIPRLLSRFNGVNAYKARSFGSPSANTQSYDESDGKFCNPTHFGQWPDATNCRQFYICQLRSNCSTGNEDLTQPHNEEDGNYVHIHTISASCNIIKVFQCKGALVYNRSTHKCEAEVNSVITCEQRQTVSIQNNM